MNYKYLGNSDLKVSTYCLGTMTFGETTSEEDGHYQLDESVASGINFIDTYTNSNYHPALYESNEEFSDQGGTTNRFQISGSGQIRGYQYGSGNFTGTAAYNLSVDSSGRIIAASTGRKRIIDLFIRYLVAGV